MRLASSPDHSQFALKNWEWSGDEARMRPHDSMDMYQTIHHS